MGHSIHFVMIYIMWFWNRQIWPQYKPTYGLVFYGKLQEIMNTCDELTKFLSNFLEGIFVLLHYSEITEAIWHSKFYSISKLEFLCELAKKNRKLLDWQNSNNKNINNHPYNN
jgi:hypothetical protein